MFKSLKFLPVVMILVFSLILPITTSAADSYEYGMTDDGIISLQMRLEEVGYTVGGFYDGYFGSLTEAAVIAFQEDNGLWVDGVAGPVTLGVLFGDSQPTQETVSAADNINSSSVGRSLSYGMAGDDVTILQTKLANLGYNVGALDGYFGWMTEQALVAYQLDHGIYADGVAGPITLGVLFDNNQEAVGSTASASVVNDSSYSGRSLSYGMTGDDVTMLQSKLADLGYNVGTLDGYFGWMTESALLAYQQDHGLYADGVAGPVTFGVLFGNKVNSTAPQTSTETTANSSYPLSLDRSLWAGMSGDDVLAVQQLLYEVGYFPFEKDGDFGYYMDLYVKEFQKDYGLFVDGVIGNQTYNKLLSLVNEVNNNPSDKQIVSDGTIPVTVNLHIGMTGNDVKALQQKLTKLGYNPGGVDGYFGNMTQNAVIAFQQVSGLYADGIAGPSTIAKLAGVNTDLSFEGSDVIWIGDSLSAFTGVDLFTEEFPDVNYGNSFGGSDSYVQGGKDIDSVPDLSYNPDGLSIINKIKNNNELTPYLVFALGVNDAWVDEFNNDKGYLSRLEQIVGTDTQIVLTTSISQNKDYSNNNEFLKQAEEKYSNVTVADWAAVAQSDYFIDDIHYNNTGSKMYLETIKESLERSVIANLLK